MSDPWIANVSEGAVELCPRVGLAPNGRSRGDFELAAWTAAPPNDAPTVVVSITDRDDRQAKLPKGWHDVLRLGFQDYDPQRNHPESAILFTPTMAARLARFARKHRGCNFLVHCAAGISRSRGVVEALLDAFPEYVDRGWPRHSNTHVKVLMKRALGLVPIGYDESRDEAPHNAAIQFTEPGGRPYVEAVTDKRPMVADLRNAIDEPGGWKAQVRDAGAAVSRAPKLSDLQQAYFDGARDGQRHADAPSFKLEQGAESWVKLWLEIRAALAAGRVSK